MLFAKVAAMTTRNLQMDSQTSSASLASNNRERSKILWNENTHVTEKGSLQKLQTKILFAFFLVILQFTRLQLA